MADTTALEHLIGGYLNQDLWDLYPGVMEGVDDFARDEPALVAPLMAEIQELLDRNLPESALTELMTRWGVGFLPGTHGYREWLVQIADRVRRATA